MALRGATRQALPRSECQREVGKRFRGFKGRRRSSAHCAFPIRPGASCPSACAIGLTREGRRSVGIRRRATCLPSLVEPALSTARGLWIARTDDENVISGDGSEGFTPQLQGISGSLLDRRPDYIVWYPGVYGRSIMRTFRTALLAGIGASMLSGALSVAAAGQDIPVMTVRMPGGAVEQIRDSGDVPPQVVVTRGAMPFDFGRPIAPHDQSLGRTVGVVTK